MKIVPEAAATFAGNVDAVSSFVWWVSLVSFVIVMGMIVYFPIKYKRRSDNDETPDIRGNHVAEAIWTIIPTILSIIIFAYGLVVYNEMRTMPEGDDVLEVKVTGRMWQWIFEYPNGKQTIGELHVPINKDVTLIMKSEDVLHSFFIPAFRTKQDVLPTHYTKLWFNATIEGEHQVFCTEYCGKDHSGMLAKTIVHQQADFDTWYNTSDEPAADVPPEEVGKTAYTKYGCNSCHSLDGVKGVGPSFGGLYGKDEALADGTTVKVDENYITESIYLPQAKVVEGYGPVMPAFKGIVSEREVEGMIAFIKTLK